MPSSVRYPCLVLLAALLATPGRTQAPVAPPARQALFGVAEGLSQSTVYALARDARGFLWAGTHDGLNRFDGHQFTGYHHAPEDARSLSHDRIVALRPDPNGDLWVLSAAGLDRLDARTGRLARYGMAERPAETTYTALAPRRPGGLWVGTSAGLHRFDTATGRFEAVAGTAIVRAAAETADGTVWVATDGGLRIVSGSALVTPEALPPPLREEPVRSLLVGRDGALWAGTAGGLFRLAAGARRFESVGLGHGAGVLAEDRDGRVWAGDSAGGLSVIDPATGAAEPVAVGGMAARVQSLWADPAGLMWVGTDGAGVLRLDPRPPKFALVHVGPEGAAERFVRSVAEDAEGALWVGTPDGLHRRDPATGRWRRLRGLPGEDVRALRLGRDGTLWVGTEAGLAAREAAGGFVRHRLPGAGRVNDLHESADGTLWVATRRGLFRRAPGGVFEGAFEPVGLRRGAARSVFTSDIRALGEDDRGRLWLGTYGGTLYRLGPSGSGDVDAEAGVELGSTITSLAADRRGRVWAGTHRGLFRLDPNTGAQRRFGTADGLPSAFVYFLLEDEEGRFWAGTNRGLVRFDPRAEAPTFRVYTPDDGLQSNEFNSNAAFRGPGGTLYAGGIAGLNAFTLASVRDDPTPPPVAFIGFKRFDEPVALPVDLNAADTLRLDWRGDAVFSFEFAGLDLADPERVRYRYRMEGVDPDWVEAGHRREARYTNLAPGTYAFHVTAANADGVWNPVGRRLTVWIPPPWWRTGWFLALGGLALVGLVGAGARALAVRTLRRRLRALEAERALDRAVQAERARISADVHDHVGATLTQIQLLSEVARRSRSGHGAASLDRIAEAARTATQDLDAIVWAINPAHDRLDAFADYLCAYAGDYCEAVGLRCRFERPDAWPEGRLPAEVRYPAFAVVKEALCNAARHARAETVHLRFLSAEAEVAVEVEDDGAGFDVQAVNAFANGLTTMRTRAEAAGGRLEVESAPGAGTRVRVVLPLQPVHEALR